MKKSISIDTMFHTLPFYERFKRVKDEGFDYLELGVWTQLDFTKIKELRRELGLTVSAMAGDRDHSLIIPEARGDFLEYLSQSLAVARDFGCSGLILHSNAVAEDGAMSLACASYSDFAKVAAATRALLDASEMAAKARVTLLLKAVSVYKHPGAFMNTTASAGDVVRVVDSPYLKLLYDVTQMQLMEGNIQNTLRRYGELIGYIQIGDMLGGVEECEVNLPGFKKFLEDELEYDGVVGFNFRPEGDAAACLEAIRRF